VRKDEKLRGKREFPGRYLAEMPEKSGCL